MLETKQGQREFGPKNIYHPTAWEFIRYTTIPQIGSTIKEIGTRLKNPSKLLGALALPTLASSPVLEGALTTTIEEVDASTCSFYPDEGNWMLADGIWIPCDNPEIPDVSMEPIEETPAVESTVEIAPPVPEPTPEPTIVPIPTSPTETPKIICSPWPADILRIQSRLSVVDGLCLVSYLNNPNPPGSGNSYETKTRTITISRGSPVGGVLNAMAHERTHAHQHWAVLNAGLGEPAYGPDLNRLWLRTPEGIDFANAVQVVLANNRSNPVANPLPWSNFGQNTLSNWLTEDEANLSADWYVNPKQQWSRYPTLQQFAQKWLPK